MQDGSDRNSDTNRQALSEAMNLQVHIAQQHVLECAAHLKRASEAMAKSDQELAMKDILEAEPLLYEAHVLLNAISIVNRNGDRM